MKKRIIVALALKVVSFLSAYHVGSETSTMKDHGYINGTIAQATSVTKYEEQ